MTAALSAGPATSDRLHAGPAWPAAPVIRAPAGVVLTGVLTGPAVDGVFLTEAGDLLTLESGDLLLTT